MNNQDAINELENIDESLDNIAIRIKNIRHVIKGIIKNVLKKTDGEKPKDIERNGKKEEDHIQSKQ